jgi:hypothetical protein
VKCSGRHISTVRLVATLVGAEEEGEVIVMKPVSHAHIRR